jgi:1-acyl-sn-glycerol-3-phosphate acyltransferase
MGQRRTRRSVGRTLLALAATTYTLFLHLALLLVTAVAFSVARKGRRTRLFHVLNFLLPFRFLNPFVALRVHKSSSHYPYAPAILVANHASLLDFAIMAAAFPNVRFLARADQSRFPIVGWMLRRAGYIFIEFKEGNVADKGSVAAAMEACKVR